MTGSSKMLRAGLDTGCPDVPDIGWKRIAAINPRNVGTTADRQDGTSLPSVSIHAAAAVAFLLLAACGDKPPPVVSGDLSCERFRHISADEQQRGIISSNWTVMESWARQIAGHNATYDEACAGGEAKPVADPRGKSK